MKITKIIGWGVLAVAGGTLFITGYVFGVMYLWNWLIPSIFSGPMLSFWQTAGLILLAKLLVGFGRGWGGNYKHYMWKQRMKERFGDMSPEQKQAFKQNMKSRWGGGSNSCRYNSYENVPEESSDKKSENATA